MKKQLSINNQIQVLQKNMKKWSLSLMNWNGRMIFFWISFPITILLYSNWVIPEWVLSVLFLIWWWIYLFGIIKEWEIHENLQEIMLINTELSKEEDIIDNISIIYEKIQTIYEIVTKLHEYKRLNPKRFQIVKKSGSLLNIGKEFEEFLKNEVFFLINHLQNLRSDLTIRLAEQQKTLEKAKSEVKQNIKWTSELNQVSELQRARLDRQIEQFEELQRVLVKA
jgi:hypothetical protein